MMAMEFAQSPLDRLNHAASKLIYTDLSPDQIRVVTLFQGEGDTPLACELKICALPITRSISVADMVKYEALSYVWGTQENPSSLTLNGQTYYVTSNLEAALRGVRFPDRPVSIWTDALCINQTNIPELNSQVSLMHHVYRNAYDVLVWIGDADASSETSMHFVQHAQMGSDWVAAVDALDDEGIIRVNDAIGDLLRREYWDRLWIVQELALAKTAFVICGKYDIPLKALNDAVLLSYSAIWAGRLSKALAVQGRVHEMAFWDGIFKSSGPNSIKVPELDGEDGDDYNTDEELQNLLSIAVIAARKKCYDCRDRIFGIYNLLPFYFKEALTIDYERDAAELFISAAKVFIEAGGCLDIISWPRWESQDGHRHPNARQIAIPSWVPDWSVPLETVPYAMEHGHWGPKRDPRTSFHSLIFRPFKVTDDNILQVKGVVVGQISATLVCPVLQSPLTEPPSNAELNELWLYLLQCYMTVSGKDRPALKIQDFMDCVAVQYKLTIDHFQHWVNRLSCEGTDLPAASDFHLPSQELAWLGRVRSVQTYRTFFTFKWGKHEEHLSRSRLGWGMTATSVREGDKLCVISGCLLPVVLRPIEYDLDGIVSDAYTDDYLVQDVLQKIYDDSVPQEDISIR